MLLFIFAEVIQGEVTRENPDERERVSKNYSASIDPKPPVLIDSGFFPGR